MSWNDPMMVNMRNSLSEAQESRDQAIRERDEARAVAKALFGRSLSGPGLKMLADKHAWLKGDA